MSERVLVVNMINQIVEVVEAFFKALLKIIDLVEENGKSFGIVVIK